MWTTAMSLTGTPREEKQAANPNSPLREIVNDEAVVAMAPYNPRNTEEPLDFEYRIKDHIEEHNDEIHLKQSILKETYNRRTQVE